MKTSLVTELAVTNRRTNVVTSSRRATKIMSLLAAGSTVLSMTAFVFEGVRVNICVYFSSPDTGSNKVTWRFDEKAIE